VRCPLICFYAVEYHLPHRVARQFGAVCTEFWKEKRERRGRTVQNESAKVAISAKTKNRLSGFEDGITTKPIKIERIGLYKNENSRA
jgi:hypothetical protein